MVIQYKLGVMDTISGLVVKQRQRHQSCPTLVRYARPPSTPFDVVQASVWDHSEVKTNHDIHDITPLREMP
jgi:hypothetical protein